jgi:hypothetical protein
LAYPGLVSTDGEYLLFGYDWDWSKSDTSRVLELISCSYARVPLQNGISRAASSPDNRNLAIVAGCEPHEIILFNLQTGEIGGAPYTINRSIYHIPRYEKICGTSDQPFWLDENTLLFSAYEGKMTETITSVPTQVPKKGLAFDVGLLVGGRAALYSASRAGDRDMTRGPCLEGK